MSAWAAAFTYRSTVSAGKGLLLFVLRVRASCISPFPIALLEVSLCLALSPHLRFCASHSCPPLRIVSYDSSSLLSTYVPPSPVVVTTSPPTARSRRPCPARSVFCSRANGVPSPLVPGFPTWLMNVTDPDGPWSGSPAPRQRRPGRRRRARPVPRGAPWSKARLFLTRKIG